MAQRHITNAVLKAIYGLPHYERFRVLDVSCGEGEIIAELAKRGCDVEGTHFKDDDYIIKSVYKIPQNIQIHKNINLDKNLPFKDESYDLVVATEVMEHLTTHFTIIREIGRILKPGGFFIFSTPNIYRLHSRLKFFFTGTHKLIRRRIGWDLKPSDLYAYHINPVDFPTLHTLLFQAGIRIEMLRFTQFKLKHAYLMLLYPIILCAVYLETRHDKKEGNAFQEGEKNLRKWLIHPAFLASEQLLVVAKKWQN